MDLLFISPFQVIHLGLFNSSQLNNKVSSKAIKKINYHLIYDWKQELLVKPSLSKSKQKSVSEFEFYLLLLSNLNKTIQEYTFFDTIIYILLIPQYVDKVVLSIINTPASYYSPSRGKDIYQKSKLMAAHSLGQWECESLTHSVEQ